MKFAWTEEQQMFREAIRAALEKECPANLVRSAWESKDGHDHTLWKKLVELGLVGMLVPESQGGLGMGAQELALLIEETGRVALPSPIISTAIVAAPLLVKIAATNEAWRPRVEAWLEQLTRGDLIVACGLSEQAPPVIEDAHIADILILRVGDQLHIVSSSEVTMTRQTSVDRSRRLYKVAWSPDKTTRTMSGVLAIKIMEEACDRGALATAAQLLGLSAIMLEMTVDYVKTREQFGKPVGVFQAVKHQLANALIKLDFAEPVVHRAAWSMSQGDRATTVHVSMAMIDAAEAADVASRAALQCHGAMGYSYEYDLHLWMKRAWALSTAWGSQSWHYSKVESHVLG